MPLVAISFLDGELLRAEVPDLSFDHPVLEAEVRSVGANISRALLPLSAIRQIVRLEVEAPPAAAELDGWDRAVFRFVDGQALRARIAPDAMLGRHGGLWRAVEEEGNELRQLAIPYTALKGVFQVASWDTRPLPERAAGGPLPATEQLARVLAEREERGQPAGGGATPLLDRVRRTGEPGGL